MFSQINSSGRSSNKIRNTKTAASGDTGNLEEFIPHPHEEPIKVWGKSNSDCLLKEPWVPAPGKTSVSGSFIEEMKNKLPFQKNITTTTTTVKSNRSFFNNNNNNNNNNDGISNVKKKYTKRRPKNFTRDINLSGYVLKTKDSLVDVAACLTKRREDVLKLWEKNLPEKDTTLLIELEKANQLALDASHDVEKLRKLIQDLQKKPNQIINANTNHLDDLRTSILSKLSLFEKAHINIQNRLRIAKSISNINILQPPPAPTTYDCESQTNLLPSYKSSTSIISLDLDPTTRRGKNKTTTTNKSNFIIIKEKPNHFLEYKTENELLDLELENVNEGVRGIHQNDNNNIHIHNEQQQQPYYDKIGHDTTTGEGDGDGDSINPTIASESIEDLSKLYNLYTKQHFKLSTLKEEMSEHSDWNQQQQQQQQQQNDEFNPEIHDYQRSGGIVGGGSGYQNDDDITRIYRDKINHLHEKLFDQETKYDELKKEIQRIESQSGFDIKMFKSNIKNRLDELESLPELLQMTEKKLMDSLQIKYILENNLQLKSQELNGVKKEVQKLSSELLETKQNMKIQENQMNLLVIKNQEMDHMNQSLKNELKASKDNGHQLELKLLEKIPIYVNKTNKNHILMEDRILELERELNKEKKRSSILKEAKDNISIQMTRRQEELLENLEDSRRRNRSLQNQIMFIKSSYQNIFPSSLLKEYSTTQIHPNDED